jgi:AcrR family transcriptional regulator
MRSATKLSAEERHAAIIKAVRRVFSVKGFHATTTRELAKAAGVSEALLFKHFPNKEALYSAMRLSCYQEQDQGRVERLRTLEPSASALIVIVHFLVSRNLAPPGADDDERTIQKRLLVRSLAEDGAFARLYLRSIAKDWIPKLEECIRAAVASGEAVVGPVPSHLAAWFAQHLAAMIKFHLLPAEPVVDYGVPREQLVEPAVWFILRGMGVKDETIKRYYNAQALALLVT